MGWNDSHGLAQTSFFRIRKTMSTNPASTMKLHQELFYNIIMTYQSLFPARWLAQLRFSLVRDTSNLSHIQPSQISTRNNKPSKNICILQIHINGISNEHMISH